MARLIRSKGVGVYFITQNPNDLPAGVLAQLSNRVQHALRAYTPAEQKGVRAAASAFRENPKFKSEDVISELGVGEALVSFLDEKGVPTIVERATILPPQSRMGTIDDAARKSAMAKSPEAGKYDQAIDRQSAYEHLQQIFDRQAQAEAEKAQEKVRAAQEKELARQEREEAWQRRERQRQYAPIERAATSTMNSIGRELGRQLIRGLFGNTRRR